MIAFDAASSGSVFLGNSITFSHTCSALAKRLLIVGLNTVSDTVDVVTGITYNGVAMTRLTSVAGGTGARSYMYYLVAPATGANDVVVSLSDSTHYIRAISASYTGVKQTGLPDGSNTNSVAPGTSVTTTVTTILDNCWNVSFCGNDGALALTNSTGISTVRGSLNSVVYLGDNNAPKTPAGAHAMTWTSASQNLAAIQMSFAPDEVYLGMESVHSRFSAPLQQLQFHKTHKAVGY